MSAAPPVPIETQIKCILREIRLREVMYPKWITSGKMSLVNADAEMQAIRAVLLTLVEIREKTVAGVVTD